PCSVCMPLIDFRLERNGHVVIAYGLSAASQRTIAGSTYRVSPRQRRAKRTYQFGMLDDGCAIFDRRIVLPGPSTRPGAAKVVCIIEGPQFYKGVDLAGVLQTLEFSLGDDRSRRHLEEAGIRLGQLFANLIDMQKAFFASIGQTPLND